MKILSKKIIFCSVMHSGCLCVSDLQCFDGHGQVVFLPDALVHLSILPSAQLVLHCDVCALHLPFVVVGRDAVDGGLVAFGRWVMQRGDQTVGHGGVMVNQLRQRVKAAL